MHPQHCLHDSKNQSHRHLLVCVGPLPLHAQVWRCVFCFIHAAVEISRPGAVQPHGQKKHWAAPLTFLAMRLQACTQTWTSGRSSPWTRCSTPLLSARWPTWAPSATTGTGTTTCPTPGWPPLRATPSGCLSSLSSSKRCPRPTASIIATGEGVSYSEEAVGSSAAGWRGRRSCLATHSVWLTPAVQRR